MIARFVVFCIRPKWILGVSGMSTRLSGCDRCPIKLTWVDDIRCIITLYALVVSESSVQMGFTFNCRHQPVFVLFMCYLFNRGLVMICGVILVWASKVNISFHVREL